jgi:hypothetical protein
MATREGNIPRFSPYPVQGAREPGGLCMDLPERQYPQDSRTLHILQNPKNL